MTYDIDFDEKGKLKLHIRKFLLYPIYWDEITNRYTYNLKWNVVKFKKSNISRLPNNKGLYCFVVKPHYPCFLETRYLFYIGQTTRTLKQRFIEYIADQEGNGKPRPKVFEMLKLYKDHLFFYYSEMSVDDEIDEVERKLLNTFVPHINTDIPKAKVNPELRNIYE